MRQRIIHPSDVQAWARQLLKDGRTTKQLADMLGVSQPAVSRIATGKTAMLGPDATLRLLVLAGGQVLLPPAPAAANDAGSLSA